MYRSVYKRSLLSGNGPQATDRRYISNDKLHRVGFYFVSTIADMPEGMKFRYNVYITIFNRLIIALYV